MSIRLDKFISESMGVSRQDAKKLITKGRIKVNAVIVKKSDIKVSENDVIEADGKMLEHEKYVYILLNKPDGVVSASRDKSDVTVVDLVKDDFPRRNLFPAGRLDKTSTGMVIITDDGNFAHNILSPSRHVEKTYIVTVDSPIGENVQQAFENGVTLADGQVMKSAVIIPSPDRMSAEIILRQGVYHQIKRMLGVYGIGVNTLHRTAVGGLKLPNELHPGEYIKLTKEQVLKIGKDVLTEN